MLFACVLVVILSTWVISRHLHLSKWDHFPGYKSWQALPLLGHAYMLGSKPMHNLFKMQATFGNIFRLDFGPNPTIIIADFKEGQEILKSDVSKNIEIIIKIMKWLLLAFSTFIFQTNNNSLKSSRLLLTAWPSQV